MLFICNDIMELSFKFTEIRKRKIYLALRISTKDYSILGEFKEELNKIKMADNNYNIFDFINYYEKNNIKINIKFDMTKINMNVFHIVKLDVKHKTLLFSCKRRISNCKN